MYIGYQKLSHVIKSYQKLSNKNMITFEKAIKCYQIKIWSFLKKLSNKKYGMTTKLVSEV